MAIALKDKPNVEAPSALYPFGRTKDDNGSGNGFPVNTLTHGDIHQFFAKIMDVAGIPYNNLPDNNSDGFQYFIAFRTIIESYVSGLVAAAPGALDTLKELADALGNDPNFAANVINQLAALNNNKANKVQAAWTNIPLANGWQQFGSLTPQYRVDQFGHVHLRGQLRAFASSSGTVTNNEAVPSAGSNTQSFLVPTLANSAADGYAIVTISDAGRIAIATDFYSTAKTYRLDGISYWPDTY